MTVKGALTFPHKEKQAMRISLHLEKVRITSHKGGRNLHGNTVPVPCCSLAGIIKKIKKKEMLTYSFTVQH